jgi:hypothetical protein
VEKFMRFRFGTMMAVAGISSVIALWAHQAQTQEKSGGKILPVLSTTDVIGYTSPCG